MLVLITAPNLAWSIQQPSKSASQNLPITFNMPHQLFHQSLHRLDTNQAELRMRHDLLPCLYWRNLAYQLELRRQSEQFIQTIVRIYLLPTWLQDSIL